MSQWGFANLTKTYLNRLNARNAMNVVSRAGRLGMSLGAKRGIRPGIVAGSASLGRGLKNWAWTGRTAAERATRIGTAAGVGFTAANFVNPRNNFGPF